MPYVDRIAKGCAEDFGAGNVGELTYLLQQVIQQYWLDQEKLSYAVIMEALTALKGLEVDIVRRILTPYEEKKQRENGEVWSQKILSQVQ